MSFFSSVRQKQQPVNMHVSFLSCLGRIKSFSFPCVCVLCVSRIFCCLLSCSLVLPSSPMFPPHLLASPSLSRPRSLCFSHSLPSPVLLLLHLILSLVRSGPAPCIEHKTSSIAVSLHLCTLQFTAHYKTFRTFPP